MVLYLSQHTDTGNSSEQVKLFYSIYFISTTFMLLFRYSTECPCYRINSLLKQLHTSSLSVCVPCRPCQTCVHFFFYHRNYHELKQAHYYKSVLLSQLQKKNQHFLTNHNREFNILATHTHTYKCCICAQLVIISLMRCWM